MGNCISMNEVYPDTLVESMMTLKRKKEKQVETYIPFRQRRRAIYYTESEARITIRSI